MKAYLKDLAERVISSAAGGAVVALSGGVFDVYEVDWKHVLGGAAAAALFSLLKGLSAFKFGDKSAALLPKEK